MKEFERGQHLARLETEGEPDIAEYLQYLNYTATQPTSDGSPSSSYFYPSAAQHYVSQ